MLKIERQEAILSILDIEKKILSTDLASRLNVSEDTIRRDLNELNEKNLLKRVHSGALRVGPPITDFSQRILDNTKVKSDIAKKALNFIKEDSVILVDGGTTNLELMKSIPSDFQCTIITNSPPIATELATRANIEIIMLGGTLYKQSMINIGIETIEALDLMRVDLYIMGIYNIDPQIGLSVPTIQEAQLKRKMASIANESIGLVTYNKFGTVSNQIIGPVSLLSHIVTDNVDPKIVEQYAHHQVIVG